MNLNFTRKSAQIKFLKCNQCEYNCYKTYQTTDGEMTLFYEEMRYWKAPEMIYFCGAECAVKYNENN